MPPLTVSDSSVDVKPAAVVDAAVRKKKKKLKKRSLDDVNNKEETKLKKKRRERFGQDFPPLFKKQAVKPNAETEGEAEYASESSVAPPLPRLVVSLPPDVDLGPLDQIEMPTALVDLEIPTVLADLHALAINPFFGVKHEVLLGDPFVAQHFVAIAWKAKSSAMKTFISKSSLMYELRKVLLDKVHACRGRCSKPRCSVQRACFCEH